MEYSEAITEYIKYIQDNEYELNEEVVKALGLDTTQAIEAASVDGEKITGSALPMCDVTEFKITDKNGNFLDSAILSNSFGNALYQTIQQNPLLLNKTSAQVAKFPTSGTNLYAGPVTGLNSLSSYPITNAVNNRGFWIDYQSNPGSSQIVSMAVYIDLDRKPHVCVIGLDSSFKPVSGWIDLTTASGGGGGGTDLPDLNYEKIHLTDANWDLTFTGYNAGVGEVLVSGLYGLEGVTHTETINYTESVKMLSMGVNLTFDLTTSGSLIAAITKLSRYGIIRHPRNTNLAVSLSELATPSASVEAQEFDCTIDENAQYFTLSYELIARNITLNEAQLDSLNNGLYHLNFNDAEFVRLYK